MADVEQIWQILLHWDSWGKFFFGSLSSELLTETCKVRHLCCNILNGIDGLGRSFILVKCRVSDIIFKQMDPELRKFAKPIQRGIFFFTEPLLLLLSTVFEWIIGNFFNMMLCGFFCVFWSSLGMLQLPTADVAASYSSTGNAVEGALTPDYNAGIALYVAVLEFAVFTFFAVTLKTNAVLTILFADATAGLFTLSTSYWKASIGDYPSALRLKHVCPLISAVVWSAS